jgi:predicted O-linked N-acetylglucosamine transferase (SPINDLY family)
MSEEINNIQGLLSANRLAEAIDRLDILCESDKGNPYLWFLLGAAHGMLGNFNRSADCCREAIRLNPVYAEAHYNLSQALIETGDLLGAEMALKTCLNYDRSNRVAVSSLVKLLNKTGNAEIGESRARYYLHNNGYDGDIGLAYLQSLLAQKKDQEAEAYLDGLSAAEQDVAGLQAAHALIAFRRQDYERAIEYYSRAAALATTDPEYPVNIALIYLAQARYSIAEQYFRQALGIKPDDARARSAYLFSLNYFVDDNDFLTQVHKQMMSSSTVASNTPDLSLTRRHGRIKVGYVSPDFRRHSVSFFIEPLIDGHKRENFEVFCYSQVVDPDDTTHRIKGYADNWKDIGGLSAGRARDVIIRDGIDILVDLAGHTGHETLPIFMPRAAPVQVTYLGYPNTTGLQTMDYRLSDNWADPESFGNGGYTEQIIRLNSGFLCYRAPAEAKMIAVTARDEGSVTFGSFNNFAKITPTVITCWTRIMQRTPGSRFIIKSKSLGSSELQKEILERFADAGVENSRVLLLGHISTRVAHLESYNDVDISLDTFPYNGTTTTCEALWMGVPVITLRGKTHASRVGCSILHQVGLEENIASSEHEYVECAVALSRNRGALAELRKTLRERMCRSMLCYEPAFVAEIEEAYKRISAPVGY